MYLDTLAAAYAETANWERAVGFEEKATQICRKRRQEKLKELESHLAMFKDKQPLRDAN